MSKVLKKERHNWNRQIARIINVKMALFGAVIMGMIVFFINLDHGYFAASIAALKQAAYTFFLGGALLKILEVMVMAIKSPFLALFIAVMITTLLTVSLVYYVHTLRGTPKPFDSTLPTICLAPIGFFAVAFKKRFGDRSFLKHL
jgi:hypothetical protein